MNEANQTNPRERLSEIERLKILADWYRSWAELAGNGEAREARLKLAEHIEAKASALAAAP